MNWATEFFKHRHRVKNTCVFFLFISIENLRFSVLYIVRERGEQYEKLHPSSLADKEPMKMANEPLQDVSQTSTSPDHPLAAEIVEATQRAKYLASLKPGWIDPQVVSWENVEKGIKEGHYEELLSDDMIRIVDLHPPGNLDYLKIQFKRPRLGTREQVLEFAQVFSDILWTMVSINPETMSKDERERYDRWTRCCSADHLISAAMQESKDIVHEYFGTVFDDKVWDILSHEASDPKSCVHMIEKGIVFRIMVGKKVSYHTFD